MNRATIRKRLITLFFILAAVVLISINGLIIFVITGPRSLNSITPYIESALAPAGSDYKVKVESSVLIWDGWRHPVGVHVNNVEVLNDKGAVIASFPEVGVRMYFFELLLGKVNIKSLEVLRPNILLVQADDGSLSLGVGKTDMADNSLSAMLTLLTADEGSQPVTHLKSLLIRNATLSVKKLHGGVFLQSADASLEVTRKNGEVKGTLSLPVQFDDKHGQIDADLLLKKDDKSISAEIVYTDIPSTILHALFPSQQWMNAAQMPISGWAHVASDFDANISKLDFMVEAGPGTIDYPSQFEEPLKIQRIRASGTLSDKLSTLSVKDGALDFRNIVLKFDGTVHKVADDYSLDGSAEVANVPVDSVHKYWPLGLSPHTRKWVTTRVSKGTLAKASIKAHFKPGELKLKDTPEQAIDAMLDLKNTNVVFLPKAPPVTDVTGIIKFTGKVMDAKVSHAKYFDDMEISSGSIRAPDLNASDVRMYVDMDIASSAQDAVRFLSLPDLDKAKKVNLTPNISGRVSGNAKLDFIAFSDDEKNDRTGGHINYDVNVKLENVSQPAFLGNRDVAGADMKVSVNNKGIRAEGRAKINRLPMTLDVNTNFKSDETSYSIKTDMPIERLPDFGLPAIDFAKGTMGVSATFTSSDTNEIADATLDLTKTDINLAEHGLNKKSGIGATLKFESEQPSGGNTTVKSFLYRQDGSIASGKAVFDHATKDFSTATFDTLKLGRHDLNYLSYSKTADSITITAKGRALDLSPYLLKAKGKGVMQGYNINIHSDRLLLGDGREFENAVVEAECPGTCRSANISAKLKDGTPFNYVISNGKLNASCDNTGELLRVLGIFENIDGGKMQMTGEYRDGRLIGVTTVTDYTLKRAPVLTKIFTIASLTGILDTLSGNGIAFSKMTAPFVYEHDIIILKEAKAHGSALGITADGSIDLRRSLFDLKGTLVPSYTMNSLIGNVPLIGDLLMGGKGKGLIALNYNVKGDMQDPSISVNPLSVFTPGFLRGIFDIFDEPAPDLDKIEADQKKAEEKQEQDKKTTEPVAAPTAPAAPPVPAATPVETPPPPPPTNQTPKPSGPKPGASDPNS